MAKQTFLMEYQPPQFVKFGALGPAALEMGSLMARRNTGSDAAPLTMPRLAMVSRISSRYEQQQ
jgi:hypothetical protein